MKLSRTSRLFTAVITLFCLLYMQLAVATYACPGMTISADMPVAGLSSERAESMPGCATMDMQRPGLCHAHAQAGNQSLDKPDLPPVAPFMAAGLLLTLQTIDETLAPERSGSPAPVALSRRTAPPIAIRHCCFRI